MDPNAYYNILRKIVEPNRTSRFNVKPDPKLSRASGLLSAFDGSPENMGSPMTTGGIAPSSMNLSLRDYEMDSQGLQPKEQKTAVNMEQPKQFQNRLSENKSSDISAKDVVKGLLKGVGMAAIGGLLGGDTGVALVGNVVNKLKAKEEQRKLERAAMVRAQMQQQNRDAENAMKMEELNLKREGMDIQRQGMQQKAFNEGMGKMVDKAGSGLKAVFDYFKTPTAAEQLKIDTAKARLDNTRKQGQKLDMQMAGTLPRVGKSGGGSGGGKSGKYPVAPGQFYNLSQDDQTSVISQMSEPEATAFLLKARASKKQATSKQPKQGKVPMSEEEKIRKEMDSDMKRLEKEAIMSPDKADEIESKKQNMRQYYAGKISEAKKRQPKPSDPASGAPAGMPPAAAAFLKILQEN